MVLNNFLKFFVFFTGVLFFLSGCSTKEVFEPKVVQDEWKYHQPLHNSVEDISSNVALLENQQVLSRVKELNVSIAPNYRVVSLSDGWVVSTSIDGNITLTSVVNPQNKEQFELKKTVASASVNGDMLAVLFANNVMALYDIPSKEILFREDGGKSVAVDMRIENPRFMNDLVVFPTLDGKIVIVNTKMKKVLRTVFVSSEDFFNNIIYFDLVDNKIIAATGYKILSLSQKEIRQKYEIRNMVHDDKNIYINTKQGEVIALTPTLDVVSKIKFPFAHFLGMILNDGKLYILENEGYMIVVDAKTFQYTIHPIDLDDGFVFVGDKVFYVDDEKILLGKQH